MLEIQLLRERLKLRTLKEKKSNPYLQGYSEAKRSETCNAGLEITAGQRTMSGLIVDLTGQTFVLPVMLTGQNSIVLKMK